MDNSSISASRRSSSLVPKESHERRLAAVLAELTDRLCRGEQVDLEQATASHPDLADDLRDVWPAVRQTDSIARACNTSLQDSMPSDALSTEQRPSQEVVAQHLPRRFGDYELLEELGRGGMGIVYKALQLSLNRLVAIKMLLGADSASETERIRFRAEAEAAASLEHPHIVRVYEVGEIDGQLYFSMQWIQGCTLADRLDEGPLSPHDAAELLAPVCRAIDFAHRNGVLHRDVKPSNILIDQQQCPLVSDFGLAKQLKTRSGLTRSGAIVGTPNYIAPEQAAGSRGELGPYSDVYSLGMILYEMMTGRPAFQAASPLDTVLLLLEQDPLPPRLLNAKVDRDLELVSLKCLQKPTSLRYASAAALADDLESFLAGEPVAARAGGFGQIVARWFRETHHASVLENWGMLWIWHSLMLLVLCLATNALHWLGITQPWPYVILWTVGLAVWAPIFWMFRRRAGPVTFVERQIAHVWAASMVASILLFVVEMLLKLPVLTLSPVLGLISGMVFMIKAGTLSGSFYIQAITLFLTALLMAALPDHRITSVLPGVINLPRGGIELPNIGLTIFGFVVAACFFFPGLKYHRQRLATRDRDELAIRSSEHSARPEHMAITPKSPERISRDRTSE